MKPEETPIQPSDHSENQQTPAELVKKHLQDPDHVITEEKIENLQVGEHAQKPEELDETVGKKEQQLDSIIPDRPPNPYDVLGG